jgi:hypothetical protein
MGPSSYDFSTLCRRDFWALGRRGDKWERRVPGTNGIYCEERFALKYLA